MNPIEKLLEHTGELDKEANELATDLSPAPPGGYAAAGLARAWRMRVVCEQIKDLLNTLILKMSNG